MYEGKNIHYSPIDQKPLCSFSGKVCNQRRLNKYGFCVRHILEDPEAPFKRCAYVAKSSKQTCTQPIPRNEERQYCNNHMQVLGMLPKKERKPKKEKDKDRVLQAQVFAAQLEHKELFQNQIRARIAADSVKNQIASIQNSVGRDDVEDIYAFPTDPGESNEKANRISTIITSVGLPDSSQGAGKTVSYLPHKSPGETSSSGSSSLAKIYPELAEKLEKIKPKLETKVKGKVKSSRTMNSLQTKIAQNKIKDKLKRNHESSASSQSQSPSSSFNSANSPGFHFRTSSPSVQAESPGNPMLSDSKISTVSEEISVKEKVTASSTLLTTDSPHLPTPSITPLPTLTQLNQLNSLGFPSLNLSFGQFGLPLPMAGDVEETLKQLAKVTHIPIEGALFPPEGAAGLIPRFPLAGLPAGALIPTADLLTLHHLLRPALGPQSGPPPPYPGTQNRPPSFPIVTPLPTVNIPSQPPEEKAVNQINTVNIDQTKQCKQTEISKHTSTSVSNSTSTVSTQSTSTLPVKSTESRKMSIVPPASLPPNQVKPSKSRTPRSKVSPVSKNRTPMALLTLPITLAKTRKLKTILSETDVKKIKTESAIKYYMAHKKRKIDNHNLLVSEFGISDSDSSDCDMLPWQPDWFAASSDEEQGDDDEDDPAFDLRTTKLALSRARLRRQCFQSRKSYCANSIVHDQDSKSVSALIAAARENARVAVKSVYEVSGNRPKPVDRYKRRGLERRKCCYKNDDDVQCQSIIVPYTNHCIKHVMYNVDQQLFEYCTAKFADNTQCCVPVIDLKHELPLCMEHGIKADNYQKLQDSEPKPKRPRKKTKPSALTRPPKKGKKKKNQRKITRPQKPLPPELPTGDTDMPDTEEELHTGSHDEGDDDDDDDDEDPDKTEDEDESPQKAMPTCSKMAILKATPSVQPKAQLAEPVRRVIPPKLPEKLQKVASLEELENLGGLPELENEKMFGELPLETASKLLEENDFQDVLNRLPEETFDIFTNKNGMFEPTNEEVEELEKSIAMANKDFKYAKDSFEQISTSETPLPPILDEADELTKQIAEEILNIGTVASSHSINSADAQESIKAIARSLSTSGQLLAPQTSSQLGFSESRGERQATSVASVPVHTQCFTQHSFMRKESVPNYSVPAQTTVTQQFPQTSLSSDQNTVSLSSVPGNTSVLTKSVTVGPSQVSYGNVLPATCKTSHKQFETGSVLQSGERILTRVPNTDTISFPANMPLSQQQQLLQLMQQSVRQQTPVQYQTIPSPSQRPPVQLSRVAPLQLTQTLTAEQLLEKQRIIHQQKQQLEAQQQQLTRQQQQLEALTQQKQQLDTLTQQQQALDSQLLQQHILQQLGTTLPPPPIALSSQSVEQQQQILQRIQQQQTLSQSAVLNSSVAGKSATQPTTLSSLPQYVNSVPQLRPPLMSPKSNQVIQTAQLLELQRQLAMYAQQQQQLLVQQNASNLPRVSDRNVHVLAQSQPVVMQTQLQKAQQQAPHHNNTKMLTNTVPSYPASSTAATSHDVLLTETPSQTIASVVTSKPQVSHMQYLPAKQGVTARKTPNSSPASEKPTTQKHKQTQQNVATKSTAPTSQTSSASNVSQASIVTSQSSLLSKIDPKTMTTKALEQHIVQMAYQQALAKQNEEDLEKSKNAKKVGSKKNSQKGTKRNASNAKKVKEIPKTPEMISRQSELEQQLAQLAKQNMAQKHAIHQKTFVKQSVSQPSTDVFKRVSNPTTTIAWKPIPSNGQKFSNGVPEDSASKKSFAPVGNMMPSGINKNVNFCSNVNVSLTTTSPLTARQVSKHLGPPPSYHHTMTASLTKSSTAPS